MTKVNQNQNPVQGWTGSDREFSSPSHFMNPYLTSLVLLDPYMYSYYNATMKRNKEDPVSYSGNYSTDIIKNKGINFIEDAHAARKPFFVGIAPIAPHVQTNNPIKHPVPAKRHEGLFPNSRVPRTGNFNPNKVKPTSRAIGPHSHFPSQAAHPISNTSPNKTTRPWPTTTNSTATDSALSKQ